MLNKLISVISSAGVEVIKPDSKMVARLLNIHILESVQLILGLPDRTIISRIIVDFNSQRREFRVCLRGVNDEPVILKTEPFYKRSAAVFNSEEGVIEAIKPIISGELFRDWPYVFELPFVVHNGKLPSLPKNHGD